MYTTIMIRTQIYIPQDTHKKLTQLAHEEAKPMAEIVRDFIEKGLKAVQKKDQSGKKTLSQIAHLKFTGGESDLSSNIDHYLYGGPKHDER
jgi:hypothetical protein